MSNRVTGQFVVCGGGRLNPAECDLLRYLMEKSGTICPYEQIMTGLGLSSRRAINTHVSQARKALPKGAPGSLLTVQGVGYMWSGDAITIEVHGNGVAGRSGSHAPIAVMDRRQVGRRLGLSAQEVAEIEASALAKLRQRPEIRALFSELVQHETACHFNPFYQVWLYATQKGAKEPI